MDVKQGALEEQGVIRKTANNPMKLIIVNVILSCILFLLLMPALSDQNLKSNFTAVDYWHYEKLGLLTVLKEDEKEITGYYQSRHGLINFRVDKRLLLENVKSKTVGYLMALQDIISLVTYASGKKARDKAQDDLRSMTGLNLAQNKWENWFAENRSFLVWDDLNNKFVIEKDAAE